jgi:FMN phosphatase YigB (HAD superfamily)
MIQVISFDMDGTLIESGYTDWVWHHGIPTLYAEKTGISFEEAKAFILEEYRKIGEGAIEWYDIKYWVQFFQLKTGWRTLLEQYIDKINVYPDVNHLLDRLKDKFPLILTSNAGREFIDVEMEATGLGRYFYRIFSATSDFQEVKKTPCFYQRVCDILKVRPEELVHVGDHYEFDYLIPRTLGIRSYYLDRSGRQKGDGVLWDLRDLDKKLHPFPDRSTFKTS